MQARLTKRPTHAADIAMRDWVTPTTCCLPPTVNHAWVANVFEPSRGGERGTLNLPRSEALCVTSVASDLIRTCSAVGQVHHCERGWRPRTPGARQAGGRASARERGTFRAFPEPASPEPAIPCDRLGGSHLSGCVLELAHYASSAKRVRGMKGENVAETALITGVTGQDGSYLAELLVERGYNVYGLVRGQNNPRLAVLSQRCPAVETLEGDLLDQSSLIAALEVSQPTEVYNLGAISFVSLSYKQAVLTGEITGLGVTRMLEAIRTVNPKIRFFQASSSEMFGTVRSRPQDELTAFHPRSPYGVAKVYAHYITMNYRESYGMFACSGIMFNHESPRRGMEFVTRKITNAAARIKLGLQENLALGNLDTERDWGFAGEYVDAMHRMLQHTGPEDFVIATGVTHGIREFLDVAFSHLGLDWKDYVVSDPRFLRPADVGSLVGVPKQG